MDRKSGLITPTVATSIEREIAAMEDDHTWTLRCAVVMPDHVHLVVVLGERLPLAQVVQRLKSKTSPLLRAAELEWERGFFDHRVRSDEDSLPLFLYVYLNPYRAGLLSRNEKWSWFHCGKEDWTWFRTKLDQDLPVPEWLT